MNLIQLLRFAAALIFWTCALAVPQAYAQEREVRVMISGAFHAAYDSLVPAFESAHGVRITTIRGPSMGNSPDAIPHRIARGEPADAVILASSSLDALVEQGKVARSSRVDLARSVIAVAVKEGMPAPKLDSAGDLVAALLAATSVGVSSSASGAYISMELYKKLGVLEQLKEKTRVIAGEPVANAVARGEVEIGFQQLSELKPVKGITIAGLLPAEVQKPTLFSAGVLQTARNPNGAAELLRYLASEAAKPAIEESGLQVPAPAARRQSSR